MTIQSADHKRMFSRSLVVAIVAMVGFAGCSDDGGPEDGPSAGTFTMDVRGPVTLDLDGGATVDPGLTNNSIQRIFLLSTTASSFYRFEITFSPAVTSPSGSFAVAAGSPVQATFSIFDRSTNQVVQLAAAQSGTLSLQQTCTLTACVGTITGQFPLGSTVQTSTITADFHARSQ